MNHKQTIIFDTISITFDPNKCIKSLRCSRRMPSVFSEGHPIAIHPSEGDDIDQIIKAINSCPTEALTWEYRDAISSASSAPDSFSGPQARLVENGPLIVTGEIEIHYPDGSKEKRERTSFCRCGASKEKPFCDGSHDLCGFRG